MFILGHLGIGSKLVSPLSTRLPKAPLYLGTLLPDMIDKPLYYGLSFATGRHGSNLGLISGTRTFGHTAVLLLALSISSFAARSRILAALALGVASHLVLDNVGDRLSGNGVSSAFEALVWPLFGNHFAAIPFATLGAHISSLGNPLTVGGEVTGGLILGWELWKNRHRPELLLWMRHLRPRFRRHVRQFEQR